MLRRDGIRVLAFISFGVAALLLILTILNLRAWLIYNQPRWWPTLLVGGGALGGLGIGLLYLKKSAVILFAASTTSIGLCIAIGAVQQSMKTGYPWVLVNVPLGLLMCLSLLPTILGWRELK